MKTSRLAVSSARTHNGTVDFTAVGLSSLCILHCLALPILSATLPVAGTIAEAEWLHKLFVLATIPFTGYALVRSSAKGVDVVFIIFAALGLGLLLCSAFVEQFHEYETPLTLVGATLLGSAHIWRWRRHSRSK